MFGRDMNNKYYLHGVFIAGIIVCICSLALFHYSIWIIEDTSISSSSPDEVRVHLDKVLVKVESGVLSASDIKELLVSSHEAFRASHESDSALVSIQEGLLGIMEAACLLYIFALLMYLFRVKHNKVVNKDTPDNA